MSTVQTPHDPGDKSVKEDGFVKVKQKPAKKVSTAVPAELDKLKVPEFRFGKRELAEMPLEIRHTSRGARTTVWVDRKGRWWRKPGAVRIQVQPDGVRRFVITLYDGANEDDLMFLAAWVNAARKDRTLSEAWERITSDWADEKTFTVTPTSRAYEDPFTHYDRSELVFACTEDACGEQWHTQSDKHELDMIRRKPRIGIMYTISVQKDLFPDPDDAVQGWYVSVYCDEFYGRVQDVASFVSDLQWAQEECRRANEGAERPQVTKDAIEVRAA